jgi:poly(3-hydroxybutyrate) depolymerase
MLNTMRIRTTTTALVLAVVLLVVLPATGAGAAKRASGGCGKPAAAGVTTRHVTVGGTGREYLLSIPDGYDASKPAPLLFDFHGLGSNMEEQALYTKLDTRGGARGYVVITPNGQGDVLRHWSLDPSASANPDVAFAQAVLRTTNRSLCIDSMRVFATGISNGAMFSTLLACALPGRLAAIAPVSGINATAVCTARTPRVSVLAFHGTGDPIVPYQGGSRPRGTGREARRRCRRGMGHIRRVRDVGDAVVRRRRRAAFGVARLPAGRRGPALPDRRWRPHVAGCDSGERRSPRRDHHVDRRHRPHPRLLRRPPPQGCVN